MGPVGDPDLELAEIFADVARSLLAERDVEETLRKITDVAVSIVDGCDHASIDIVEKRVVRPVASTSDVAARISQIESETQEGPCYDAIREHEVFHSDDLMEEARWPNFAHRAFEETGVRSMIGFRLFVEEETMGALDLYSLEPHAFDDATAAIGAVLAAHAAVALSAARERAQMGDAMKGRDLIGQAKGILMNRHHIDADAAFEMLRGASQQLNVKLREVAEQTVYTGEVPQQQECPPKR